MQTGFTVDLNLCTGCQACVLACSIENEIPISAGWRSVLTFNAPRHTELPVFHLSLACHHCHDPACMRGCPSLAYSKDAVTGAVTLDADECIGCRYCMWMCPYDAPRYDTASGTVHKCTFCNDRLHQGLEPACVSQCPTSALGIQDQNGKPLARTVTGFPTTQIGPAIDFVPLRFESEAAPIGSGPAQSSIAATIDVSIPRSFRKISLRAEWTLLIFTVISPLLFGWFSASLIADVALNPLLYCAFGFSAMGLSTMHLGKRLRAYRAVLNWRHSWLSREIIFFSIFLSLSGVLAFGVMDHTHVVSKALVYVAVLSGLAALVSMDMVYVAAATVRPTSGHSASVALTGALFLAVLARIGWLAAVAGCIKLVRYGMRRTGPNARNRSVAGTMVILARVLLGILLPGLIWISADNASLLAASSSKLALSASGFWIVVCCILGELIDRAEFYDELDVVTPRRQLHFDLHSRLQSRQRLAM